MKLYSSLSQIIIVILFSVLIVSGCSSSEQIISSWPAQGIRIDGDSRDWEGGLQSFTEKKYSVGFKNDSKYLYICFITSDRTRINRIISSGLNILFNSKTDDRRDYTISFPVLSPDAMKGAMGQQPGGDAMPRERMSAPPQGEGMQKPGEGKPGQGNNMPNSKQDSPLQQMLERQISFNLIEKDYTNSISLKNNEGIDLKMDASNDFLVYELKIPLLSAKSSFPIGVLPGEEINITIETPEMKMPDKGNKRGGAGMQTGGDMPGAGMQGGDEMQGGEQGGMGGRGGRGGMGGPGGRQTGASKTNGKFSAEFSVKLTKPAVKSE